MKARGDLTIWLDQGMPWFAPPSDKRGRNRTFSDAAIQFCLTIKCLFGYEPDDALLIEDAEDTQETEALRDLGFIE
ncbi:DDE family transposase [Comamonas sp. AG1104]|nr:DDE family transposase [Comamonas sp. AG1104]